MTSAHRELMSYELKSKRMQRGEQEKPEMKVSVIEKDSAG